MCMFKSVTKETIYTGKCRMLCRDRSEGWGRGAGRRAWRRSWREFGGDGHISCIVLVSCTRLPKSADYMLCRCALLYANHTRIKLLLKKYAGDHRYSILND